MPNVGLFRRTLHMRACQEFGGMDLESPIPGGFSAHLSDVQVDVDVACELPDCVGTNLSSFAHAYMSLVRCAEHFSNAEYVSLTTCTM